MGRPEGKTFCANALGLEETHVQRIGGKGGERERERERDRVGGVLQRGLWGGSCLGGGFEQGAM